LVERKLPKLEVAGSRPVVRFSRMKSRLSPFAVIAVVGVVALLGLLAYGLGSSDPERGIDAALARGERVDPPPLELDRLSGGGEGSLDEYRGKVVVVNAWASWCGPCREELPLLQRWHERISQGGRGTVLGVAGLGDVSSDSRDFVRKYGLTYPQLRDPEGETLTEWGVIGYPETFVIDSRGKIAAIERGVIDDAFMRDEVLPLLEQS
jgi:cytochrome c biogenesis protein CcmG/thiol:disulfide interchange protein DsbE